MTGRVKWYNANKGYGFIIGEDGNEYFVCYKYIDTILGILQQGFGVSFNPDKEVMNNGKMGLVAYRVKYL